MVTEVLHNAAATAATTAAEASLERVDDLLHLLESMFWNCYSPRRHSSKITRALNPSNWTLCQLSTVVKKYLLRTLFYDFYKGKKYLDHPPTRKSNSIPCRFIGIDRYLKCSIYIGPVFGSPGQSWARLPIKRKWMGRNWVIIEINRRRLL